MPRIAKSKSARRSAILAKQDGMHAMGDPPGLYLAVDGNSRSWILRYTAPTGRRRDFGLGSYRDLSLAEAREAAKKGRKKVLDGIDPIEAKREERHTLRAANARRMTFDQCVTGYIDGHGDGWRNPKHRAQWQNTLDTYARPIIGGLDVAKVDLALVLRCIEPIWKLKTETAKRLRGRIENVLSWATVRGYRSGENPARWKGNLDQLLAAPSKVSKVEHHPAIKYQDIGAFMAELRKHSGIGAAALEFAILTAARTGEVRGATWGEFDLDARKWTIPASRMKADREHVVPLSDAAVRVIHKMQDGKLGEHVFPGVKDGKPLSDMSLTAVLRRMGRRDLTVHGFRSSFRDWAAESTGYPSEMAEMALAHAVANKVEAAYRRGNLFMKRVRMMQDWAKHCAEPSAEPMRAGTVLPMKRAAK